MLYTIGASQVSPPCSNGRGDSPIKKELKERGESIKFGEPKVQLNSCDNGPRREYGR